MKSTDVSWSDTRRILRKDHRWESAALLERHEKEKLFEEHVEVLTKRKKEHFRQLLDETTMVRGMLLVLIARTAFNRIKLTCLFFGEVFVYDDVVSPPPISFTERLFLCSPVLYLVFDLPEGRAEVLTSASKC